MRALRPHALVLIAALALATAAATDAAALTKKIGPTAGFNLANLKIEGQDGVDGRSTFAIGAAIDLGINERFGIRIDPTYLSNGAKAQNRNAYWGTMDGAVFKLDYISVPVLARYDLSTAESRPYLLGGLGLAFATSSKVELTQGQDRATVDFKDIFSSTDLSLDLGAGISFPAGGNRLNFDGRAAIGLVDINNGGTVTFNGQPLVVPSTSTKSLCFRIMASYLFSLK